MSSNWLASLNADSLSLFAAKKGQKLVTQVSSKKDKKAKKKALLEAKLEGKIVRDNDGTNHETGNVENLDRKAFTPGWMQSLTSKEALPIKQNGKVIRSLRENKDQITDDQGSRDEENDDDDDEDEGNEDVEPDPKSKRGHQPKESRVTVEVQPESGIYEYAPEPELDLDTNMEQFQAVQKKGKKDVDESNVVADGVTDKRKRSKASIIARFLNSITLYNARNIIGTICNTIMADPEKSLRRSRPNEDIIDGESPEYKFCDLLSILQHTNVQIVEMAMLSCVLVFKDIIPGYRIRSLTSLEKETQVKKETKRLRDYENAILGAYQQYLNILHKQVVDGLKNPKKVVNEWDVSAKLGLSALRCQCELLRAVPHFNCRIALLTSIVTRAAQPDVEVSSVSCGALELLFKNDAEGEASFEAVRLIGKTLAISKYDVPVGLVHVLTFVKLRVHADDAKRVHRKAKSERRKKRKDGDGVDALLLESDANPEKSHVLRFQADSLQEICLVYFRIIKMKIGFELLPVALEGLGRISHLINIDTVADLVTLMSTVLHTTTPSLVPLVQLHCIHCALKTLSGPGEELKMDDEVFVTALRALLKEIPVRFDRWDVVLECIDLALNKRRENRASVVIGFVKLLIIHSSHVISDPLALALLSMANTVLLKYPRVRSELFAIAMATANAALGASVGAAPDVKLVRMMQEDDEVCDLAMKSLRGAEAAAALEDEGDGSWLLSLLKSHVDSRYARTILSLTAKEVATIPLRLSEAKGAENDRVMARVEATFNAIPSTISVPGAKSGPSKGNSKSSSTSSTNTMVPKKMTKMQEKNARRKVRKNEEIREDATAAMRQRNNSSVDGPATTIVSFLEAVNGHLRRSKRGITASSSLSLPPPKRSKTK